MVECQQVLALHTPFREVAKRDSFETGRNLGYLRRVDAGLGQRAAQRIDVGAIRNTAHQGGLDRSRAAPHERVVYDIARSAVSLNEILRQLRLEARAVAHFVEARRLPLPGGPEFARFVKTAGSGRVEP